jgi:hypothetical protein
MTMNPTYRTLHDGSVTPVSRQPVADAASRGVTASANQPVSDANGMIKPTGPIFYTVSSGADVWPNWRELFRSVRQRWG